MIEEKRNRQHRYSLGAPAMAIEVRAALPSIRDLIDKAIVDRIAVEIVTDRGNAILGSSAEYASMTETRYLLSTPANAMHLFESIEQVRRGEIEDHELVTLDVQQSSG